MNVSVTTTDADAVPAGLIDRVRYWESRDGHYAIPTVRVRRMKRDGLLTVIGWWVIGCGVLPWTIIVALMWSAIL